MEQMTEENKVILDGIPVTKEYLREQQQRSDVRIVEVKAGEYKTLNRMHG